MDFSELDALIASTDQRDIRPDLLLELQQRIAAQRYYLIDVVRKLSREAGIAEVDRKSAISRVKLTKRAEHGTSIAQATEQAEQDPEIIRLRSAEVFAAADYEAAKLKLHASGDVLVSLAQRISSSRDDRRESYTHQKP
jgi:hypothetical protein